MVIRGILGSTTTSRGNYLVVDVGLPNSCLLTDRTHSYLLNCYEIMCSYGKAIAEHGNCDKPQRHKIEKRLCKRCEASPKSGPRCNKPTHDPSLDALPSTKGGPCLACRDSATSVEIYKIIWVSCGIILFTDNTKVYARWTLMAREF